MRIIAIGDIHGRDLWEEIIRKERYDKIIFMGDYFNTKKDISPYYQEGNFREIIRCKRQDSERVVLLFGNHDYHYLRGVTECYSGYQELQRFDIEKMLEEAISEHLLQMCFVQDNFLFSHAGITQTWLAASGYDSALSSIETFVNNLFKTERYMFEFERGANNSYDGDDISQSPIWVRPPSLCKDLVSSYVQVVGHTQQEKITIINDRVVLIDTLGVGQYLSITDGVLKTEQL